MKIYELKQDEFIKEWLLNLNPVENTENAYLQGMQAYTDFVGKSSKELILEAEGEITSGILPRQRKIKTYLMRFKKQMQDQNLADFTIRGRITGVRSFYKSFDIEIPNLQSDKRRARTIKENNLVPKKEDLQDVLKVCDPLEKAIMLTGISSGLSSNEIQNLKLDDFKKGYDSKTGITTFNLTRGKTGVEFVTFLSPEASKAVLDYLEFRDRDIKAATCRRKQQVEKQRTLDNDGYLFILRQVPDEFLQTQDDELRKLTENAISKLYRAISDKAKKSTKQGFYNVVRSHTMRKYYNSAMLNAGADSQFVEFTMGHSLGETKHAYYRPDNKQLKEMYQKFIPYLTIEKSLDISVSPEYLAIVRENEILRSETARHVVERREVQDLKAEIERMKQLEREKESLDTVIMEAIAADPKILNMLNAKISELSNNKN
ncbi:tyrosine-type recombinase/integrase [Methanosarcina sp.]|uniref:tyrosine-type recombinase/integrase n=1 Tax=Methanosarcina sp. TaxID=2213 RepID=UPI003C73CA6B